MCLLSVTVCSNIHCMFKNGSNPHPEGKDLTLNEAKITLGWQNPGTLLNEVTGLAKVRIIISRAPFSKMIECSREFASCKTVQEVLQVLQADFCLWNRTGRLYDESLSLLWLLLLPDDNCLFLFALFKTINYWNIFLFYMKTEESIVHLSPNYQ